MSSTPKICEVCGKIRCQTVIDGSDTHDCGSPSNFCHHQPTSEQVEKPRCSCSYTPHGSHAEHACCNSKPVVEDEWEGSFDDKFWYLDKEPDAVHAESCECHSVNRRDVKAFIRTLLAKVEAEAEKRGYAEGIKMSQKFCDQHHCRPEPKQVPSLDKITN